jgi:hypothetical protein
MKALSVLFCLFLAAALLVAQAKSARMTTVTPEAGKADVAFSVAGENLTADAVKELYLTNGKDDIRVAIVEQKAEAIQFKVPGGTKAGRYSLMILTGDGKNFIEQPVKVTIE